jgi:hypothetical protein
MEISISAKKSKDVEALVGHYLSKKVSQTMDKTTGWKFVTLLLCSYAVFAWEIIRNIRAHEPLRVGTDIILVIVFTRLAYASNRP